MKKEVFEQVKKELEHIGILFIVVLIVFKIAFFKENLLVSLRGVLSLFWLFVLPGYFLMLYWKENLEFMERIIVGAILAAAIVGIASYYLGLLGLNIKYHSILLPMVLILIGVAANLRKEGT